jgi:hypothetical protein
MILTADCCKLRLTKHNLQGLFVGNYLKHIKSRAPDLTIDMFGDETDPLKHLTVEDALTLISLGWKSEARIEELSRPVRVELVSVYHYGDPHHLDESWQEIIEMNVNIYNGGLPDSMDMAKTCALSRPFAEYVISGLRRLKQIPSN